LIFQEQPQSRYQDGKKNPTCALASTSILDEVEALYRFSRVDGNGGMSIYLGNLFCVAPNSASVVAPNLEPILTK
jgi:hypothetical protein